MPTTIDTQRTLAEAARDLTTDLSRMGFGLTDETAYDALKRFGRSLTIVESAHVVVGAAETSKPKGATTGQMVDSAELIVSLV